MSQIGDATRASAEASTVRTETIAYADGVVATGPAPLPISSPASRTPEQVIDLVEDYGQWLWDAGYMDNPRGEILVDDAAERRQEIRKAIEAIQLDAYAEGRKDQLEEQSLEATTSRLIDAWCTSHGKQIPWATAVEITAIVTKMPEGERLRLLALEAA